MYRILLLAAGGVCALGCGGPITRPLPERLDEASQKNVDAHWEKAIAPVNKHDRATWLDVMVGTRAYENGVDRFTFKSEKAWTGGTVVMEANFDRTKPADDRFTITVLNKGGQVLRKESYTRDEVDTSYAELFPSGLPPKAANEPPAIASRRAASEARWARVEAVLPKANEDK